MQAEKSKNIPYLDGWRGMAILLVLMGHFGPWQYAYLGHFGVVAFFVLSGFFMGRILFIKKPPLSTFFARRFIRIIPTMWVYITLMYFFSEYFLPHPYKIPMVELFWTYVFLGTYLPGTVSIWSENWPNGHLWSLNVEEHCYVYLAAGSFLVAKAKNYLSNSLFLLGSVFFVAVMVSLYMTGTIYSAVPSPWKSHTEVASLGLLASAAYVALNFKGNDNWWSKTPIVPIFALAIAIRLFVPRYSFTDNLSMLVSPFFAAIAVNHANSFPNIIKNIFSLKVLRWFGTCSFSIYLWQQPFFYLCLHNGFRQEIALPAAIAVGAISFYIIENPSRNYLNRQWDKFENSRSVKVGVTI